jgi:hypothetical protein
VRQVLEEDVGGEVVEEVGCWVVGVAEGAVEEGGVTETEVDLPASVSGNE